MNTGVVERNGKTLLIDSGNLTSGPGSSVVDWALYTHHHRDQAAGAARLASGGTKIAAPDKEAYLFEDARAVWDSVDRRLYYRRDFRPSLFTPREPVPMTRRLKHGDVLDWEGLKFEVIDTPGHTDGSVAYMVELAGKRVAFTGDLIYGPGQIWEVYSLQKTIPKMKNGYTGFGGASGDVISSLDRVLERKPHLLVPSHGVVITDPPAAAASLKENLDALMNNFLTTAAWRVYLPDIHPKDKPPMLPPRSTPDYPRWFREITSTSRAFVADDKSVFLTDCGSPRVVEKLSAMQASKEIGPIDVIWITHYHDDHTQSINLAGRRFGSKIWVQQEMVDIAEHPTAYNMPCLFPEAIHADRIVGHGETIEWKGFRMTGYYFPGQTLYHAGLLVERDGFKLFMCGDSFGNWGIDDYCSENRNFLGPDVGYERCLKLLLKKQPDMMVNSHWGRVPVFPDYLRKTIALLEERQRLYRKLLPYDDVNFGTDPFWIRAYPYRQSALRGGRVEIDVRIMNHASKTMSARATLELPEGWKADFTSAEAAIPAHTEGRIRLCALAPQTPERRRHVIGISTIVNGTPFHEFAEALVETLT